MIAFKLFMVSLLLFCIGVPPFVPTVTSMDDTSNFDEFDPAPPQIHVDTFMRNKGFTGKDLPFVGFTFTKSLQDGTVR